MRFEKRLRWAFLLLAQLLFVAIMIVIGKGHRFSETDDLALLNRAPQAAAAEVVSGQGRESVLKDALAASAGSKKLFKACGALETKKIQLAADSRKEMIQHLNLVGIVSDKDVQAVIEDTKTSKIYYVKAGDSLSGVAVKAIKDQEVVLDDAGAQYSLLL